MIGYLKGRLFLKMPSLIMVMVNGVGYELETSLKTFSCLPDEGEEVSLWVHTYLKDAELKLFGFATKEEKQLFTKLIAISGVGPKLALNVLSRLTPQEFETAIVSGDIKPLKAIPGIGRKTAQRILLELKDKWEIPPDTGISAPSGLITDVVSALVNLGYQKKEAQEAACRALKQFKSPPPIEELIKEALKAL